MLDIKLLRESPDTVKADLKKRGRPTDVVDTLREHDTTWREGRKRLDDLRAERNQAAKAIAEAKKAGDDASKQIAAMGQVSGAIKALEQEVDDAEAERDRLLRSLPNLMHPDVPVGADDAENVEVRRWPEADPAAKPDGVSHVDLLESLDVADLERAARAAGARFFYLKNDLVMLGRALEFYALQHLQGEGFTPVEPPYMLRREAVEGAVDLQDFEDVIYRVETPEGEPGLYLIATSEHPLAALHMGEIFDTDALPRLYAGVSPCFRKEAGAHGKDTKGIFRVHQFSKVEQFVYCHPDDSWDWHDKLLANAEALYRGLGIPYRVVDICTGDLGTVAARKFDIEAWMPVQGAYREVVSCSNCTDYQARRYNTRHRPHPGDPTEPVHTLNSTAIAVQRTLVAILENFQNEDGSVTVPEPLRPFLGGKERIEPAGTADAASDARGTDTD